MNEIRDDFKYLLEFSLEETVSISENCQTKLDICPRLVQTD